MNKWFIVVLIFLFSVTLRLWNLNEMGRTWDEPEYVEQGYKLVELIKNKDFNNSFFYTTYDHPPLVKYLYGLAAHLDVSSFLPNGQPIFRYDLTSARLLSVFISSLSVLIVTLLGWQFISRFVGVASGIILAMLPFFLGFSQLVSTESMTMFFFTASVYSFMVLLKKYSVKRVLLTGILTGLALQTKQSNSLLFPLFGLMYIVWYLSMKKKKQIRLINTWSMSILSILIISIAVFVLLWPMPYFHFHEFYSIHQKLWEVKLSQPEVFFGRLMLTPEIYYPVMFLITTPVLILTLFLIGLKGIDNKKGWILYALIFWFAFPFIQSFYPWRQHGVRYIIQIYAPLSLISAIGLDFIASKFTKKDVVKFIYFLPVVIYLFVILLKITPYYLDYFNIVVGGTKGAYDKKMFQLGWWGQGMRKAGFYVIQNAPKGSHIGLAVSPIHSIPPMPGLHMGKYSANKNYDFVIVNYYNILREGFDDSEIKRKYSPVYYVNADGGILGTVYKQK